MGEFNASKLADFGAALTTADEPLLQEVLEELDVSIFSFIRLPIFHFGCCLMLSRVWSISFERFLFELFQV
jgi:hypothetical protein